MMRFRHVTLALAMVALTGSLAVAQAPEGQRGAAPGDPRPSRRTCRSCRKP